MLKTTTPPKITSYGPFGIDEHGPCFGHLLKLLKQGQRPQTPNSKATFDMMCSVGSIQCSTHGGHKSLNSLCVNNIGLLKIASINI